VIGNQWETAYGFRGPLIQALIASGLAVDVVGPDVDDPFRERVESLGARTHRIAISRAGKNPLNELATVLALARLLRQLGPDVSFAYFAKPVIYTSLAGALARVPARYALIAGLGHAFSGDGSSRRVLAAALRCLYRIALRLNRRVFFQNPDDQRLFLEAGIVEHDAAVRIAGTGVDLAFYDFHEPAAEPITFVLAARLIAEKGIRELAEAARILRDRGWRPRCVILGGLDDNPSALRRAELDAWVDERIVEWAGAVEDIRPWLRESSVYVLPSYYREGVPRSIQEAMALGRPIITTDMPGCRETVEPGRNGLLVSPRDAAALADAMERYLVDTDRIEAEGRESRRLAESCYDVHRINLAILEHMGIRCGSEGPAGSAE
jgi:glycosyltransferase involved in cell wall biosynthesis